MRQRNKSDVARSQGAIQTDVTVLELDRSALQTLYRKQHVVVESDEYSVLLYVNGGDVNGMDIAMEANPDGRCNVSVDSFGRLLRGDTVYWGDNAFAGNPLIIDSCGGTLDIEHPDQKSEKLIKQDGW